MAESDNITVKQAAKLLGVGRHRIEQFLKAKRLHSEKFGRAHILSRQEVLTFSKEMRRGGRQPIPNSILKGIRDDLRRGDLEQKAIAANWGVHESLVSYIKNGKRGSKLDERAELFGNNCPISDGRNRCWEPLEDNTCPVHGDVSEQVKHYCETGRLSKLNGVEK